MQWRFSGDTGGDERRGVPLRSLHLHPNEPESPQDALVVRLRAGDEHALEQLFESHYDQLCAYALHIVGSIDLAESVVLDVMTSLWDRRERLELRGSMRAYLVGAVRLRAMNRARAVRTEANWTARAALETTLPGMGALRDVDAELTTHEVERALARAVAHFPPRCRAVFLLSWYGGLTYAEIAAQLDISVKGVEGQMARAYRLLRDALERFR